jgi:threonine/homoserine/homoserine lactone efflux protein
MLTCNHAVHPDGDRQVAFLPQFVDPSLGRQPLQLFVLGLTLLALGLAVDLTIGGGTARWPRG